jgi:lipoprotein-anchoring transpeptidase ErfK/SrfK
MKRLVLLGLLSIAAAAATMSAHAETAGAPQEAARYQVAQSDVGFFVDSHGRRVYFDRQTNRIIAVEEPQPLKGLLERVLPPLAATPRDDSNDFPPAPQTPPQPRSFPGTADPIPAPETVERAPLDERSPGDGKPRIRSLDELLAEQNPDAPARITPPDAQAPQPRVVPAPGAEETPAANTKTAAMPRPEPNIPSKGPVVVKLQVLLDRLGYSPGVIDGQMGSNVRKAVAAASQVTGVAYTVVDEATLDAELDRTGGPAFAQYVITPEDVAGPFAESIPTDYAEKAKMPAMSFTSPAEMLAERFHMAQNYLEQLNPDVNFYRAGTTIRVVAVGQNVERSVAHIEADKANEQVRAYDEAGRLIAAYPATIGSSDTPSPSGLVQVDRVAIDPNYTYNPKVNFVQGTNTKVLTIPPGPNGPVGSIWIALSKPTYGIHGTPEPDRIGKTNSHGCVRLTNWDAAELARLVTKGVTVEFID